MIALEETLPEFSGICLRKWVIRSAINCQWQVLQLASASIQALLIYLKTKNVLESSAILNDMVKIGITSFSSEIAEGVQYDDLSSNVKTLK